MAASFISICVKDHTNQCTNQYWLQIYLGRRDHEKEKKVVDKVVLEECLLIDISVMSADVYGLDGAWMEKVIALFEPYCNLCSIRYRDSECSSQQSNDN